MLEYQRYEGNNDNQRDGRSNKCIFLYLSCIVYSNGRTSEIFGNQLGMFLFRFLQLIFNQPDEFVILPVLPVLNTGVMNISRVEPSREKICSLISS